MTNSTIVAAIVTGAVGVVLMMLGSIFYWTNRGDSPSRKAVGSEEDKKEIDDDNEALASPPQKSSQEAQNSSKAENASPDIEEVAGRGVSSTVPQPPGESDETSSNPPPTSDDDETLKTAKEELIELYVPAGKLGFTLGESIDESGPPVVHEIRQASILENDLQVGDRLIALDDEDVRTMRAETIARLISRKSENPTRKLSILRTVALDV